MPPAADGAEATVHDVGYVGASERRQVVDGGEQRVELRRHGAAELEVRREEYCERAREAIECKPLAELCDEDEAAHLQHDIGVASGQHGAVTHRHLVVGHERATALAASAAVDAHGTAHDARSNTLQNFNLHSVQDTEKRIVPYESLLDSCGMLQVHA